MSGVSIHDMQSFAESMNDTDVRVSSDIGYVIDLGSGGGLGDDLGFGLLTNTKVIRNGGSSSSSNTVHVPMSNNSGPEISIGPLEPLEAVSFEIPTDNQNSSMPEFTVNREGSGSSPSDNSQTATGPSINLTTPLKRLSPEEERKEKADMINKLNRLESKGFSE